MKNTSTSQQIHITHNLLILLCKYHITFGYTNIINYQWVISELVNNTMMIMTTHTHIYTHREIIIQIKYIRLRYMIYLLKCMKEILEMPPQAITSNNLGVPGVINEHIAIPSEHQKIL